MRETIVRGEAQLADKKADDPAVVAELQRIREILAQREKVLFGPSSERRPAIVPKPEPKPKTETKPKGHGPTPQPPFPNVTVTHELDASQQLCTVCDGQLIEWAGQEGVQHEREGGLINRLEQEKRDEVDMNHQPAGLDWLRRSVV